MNLGGNIRIYKVARPKEGRVHSSIGYNSVIVSASNEKSAKKVAVENTYSLIDNYEGGVSVEDLLVIDITEELEDGYIIAKE